MFGAIFIETVPSNEHDPQMYAISLQVDHVRFSNCTYVLKTFHNNTIRLDVVIHLYLSGVRQGLYLRPDTNFRRPSNLNNIVLTYLEVDDQHDHLGPLHTQD